MAHWRQLLAEVVQLRRSALVGYAALLTLNWAEAEDVVQEAFVRTFARERSFKDARAAEAYIRQAVRTVFIDGTRRRKAWSVRVPLLTQREVGRPAEDAAIAGLDVQRALALLTPRERACAVLRFFDDLGVQEIAGQLALSDGAVKRYLADASAKLRAALGDSVEWQEEELYDAPVAVATLAEGSGS